MQVEINGERRRFYIVSPDASLNSSDFSFVNKATALVNGRTAGTHQFPVKGLSYPRRLGVPPLLETPKLVVQIHEDQLLDVYGLGQIFISGRAKALLEDIDSADFEFAECETVNGDGLRIESYWMVDVIRGIDQFNEQLSSFQRVIDLEPNSSNPLAGFTIRKLNDIVFYENLSREIHEFYILRYYRYFIFDALLADRWRAEKFSGVRFTPLQPPSAEEMTEHDYFRNYPYWTKRGSEQ